MARRKQSVSSLLRAFSGGRFNRRGGIGGLIIIIILFVIGLFSTDIVDRLRVPNGGSNENSNTSTNGFSVVQEGTWPVVRVVDGDTIIIQNEQGDNVRVRLTGVDTPETVKPNWPVEPFGPEASAFTKKMIEAAGNQVRIAFDGDQTDRYNRSLAMIYLTLPEGEVWLNERIIQEGLGRAELQYRFSKTAKSRFQAAEQEAQKNRRNLWSIQHP
ncbi:MAG: thermonuclease family protein [Thermoguttaceae bacterium]